MAFLKNLNFKGLETFIKEAGFKAPTEVQKQVMPKLLDGESVNVLAQTGTGKTLCYLLPLVHMIKKAETEIGITEPASPRAIIVAPTRELGRQILSVAKSIAHHAKFKVRLLEGGDQGKKVKQLKDEYFDVLVANPGRLLSSVKRKEIKLNEVKLFVFDEADQLLDLGFAKDLKVVVAGMPAHAQMALFSATFHPKMLTFQEEVFEEKKFEVVEVDRKNTMIQRIETYNVFLGEKEKLPMLDQFIKKEQKASGIIFVNKKEEADVVMKFLQEKYPKMLISVLHGALEANVRKKEYDRFVKEGGILVASDIAARGIDVQGLAWVLNFSLPFEAIYYIHRAGRTGRAGQLGKVINFVLGKDAEIIKRINEAILSQTALVLKAVQAPKKQTQSSQAAPDKKAGFRKGPSDIKRPRTKKLTPARHKKVVKRAPRFARKKS